MRPDPSIERASKSSLRELLATTHVERCRQMPALYDLIGGTYARPRRADPAIAQTLARELGLTPSGAYLDLACGTGNYTVALSALGGKWRAIDVSEVMLGQAREKSSTIAWAQSSADALPFPDAAFAGAICTHAIHHFPDLESPFAEVRRTLRSGPSAPTSVRSPI